MKADAQVAAIRGGVPGNAEPTQANLVPFGPYGVGQMTGHPIGLVIVIGILLMGLLSRTPAAFLMVASFLPGCIWGFILWRRHGRKESSETGLALLKL